MGIVVGDWGPRLGRGPCFFWMAYTISIMFKATRDMKLSFKKNHLSGLPAILSLQLIKVEAGWKLKSI